MTNFQGREILAVLSATPDYAAGRNRLALRVRQSSPAQQRSLAMMALKIGVTIALCLGSVMAFMVFAGVPLTAQGSFFMLGGLCEVGVLAWVLHGTFSSELVETSEALAPAQIAKHEADVLSAKAIAAASVAEISAGFAKPFTLSPWLSIPTWHVSVDAGDSTKTIQRITVSCDLTGTSEDRTASRRVAVWHHVYYSRDNDRGYVDSLRAAAVEQLRDARGRLVKELQIVEAV